MAPNRRRRVWAPINSGTSVAASGSKETSLLANLPIDLQAIGGVTVVRIVGELKYRIDTVGQYQQFSAAIAVVHEDLDPSALSLSGEPLDLLWSLYTRTSGLFMEVGAGNFDAIEEVRAIDVRAKRIIKPQEQLILIVNNGAGDTLFFNVGLRTLVLLP